LYKYASISLCPPVSGQIMVELMVNPPKEGEPSHAKYIKEIEDIYGFYVFSSNNLVTLKSRAEKLEKAFNKLSGVSCQSAQGSLYLFPRVDLPVKAIAEAEKQGIPADEFYCMELLEATGVCMVPGAGFLQYPGSFHFRSTFLPPSDEIDAFIESISGFHESFMVRFK
jgi:aspartate/methionine/tyrosine aminotransferase